MNSKRRTTAARGQKSEVRDQTPSSAIRRPSSVVCHPSSAFTLIELLVVIVVIAILVGVTLPLARYAMRRANEARQEVMLAKMRSALEDYRAAYGEYPITPPAGIDDVNRHYPANYDYPTLDAVQSNSSSTHVRFNSSNIVEIIYDIHGSNACQIDYSLTYPLMFKQLDKGARPFMVFPIVDVVYLVTRSEDADKIEWFVSRRRKGGGKPQSIKVYGIYGDAVQRAKAIDPVSGLQWNYVCPNGINYSLTTNSF